MAAAIAVAAIKIEAIATAAIMLLLGTLSLLAGLLVVGLNEVIKLIKLVVVYGEVVKSVDYVLERICSCLKREDIGGSVVVTV